MGDVTKSQNSSKEEIHKIPSNKGAETCEPQRGPTTRSKPSMAECEVKITSGILSINADCIKVEGIKN